MVGLDTGKVGFGKWGNVDFSSIAFFFCLSGVGGVRDVELATSGCCCCCTSSSLLLFLYPGLVCCFEYTLCELESVWFQLG